MVTLDGAVEVNESDTTPATAFRPNLATFRLPSGSPPDGFTTLLVRRRSRVLDVFVNGEALGDPVRLERDYGPGKQAIAVWDRINGEARAEFARYTLWRLS
jgi:hypothetical protein